MNSKISLYSIANKIRTKLLLFIDKEIQSQKKNYILPISKNNHEEKNSCIIIEEAYSQKKAEIIFSDLGFLSKTIKNENTKKTFSTCNDTPLNTTKVKDFNNIIYLEDKKYSINKKVKPSSTFIIFEKPKIDKKYLKALCGNLKLSKKNFMYSNKPLNVKNIKICSSKSNLAMNKRNFSNSFKNNNLNYQNEKHKQRDYIKDIKCQKLSTNRKF